MSGLEDIVDVVLPQGPKSRRKLRVHFFHALKGSKAARDTATDLSFAEALALLEKRPYKPESLTWIQRVEKLQQLVLSPTSIFAAKSATAGTIFGLKLHILGCLFLSNA